MLASWKAKIVAFFGAALTLLIVYFVGRRNRNGEVNVAVAQRELELANAKHDKLQEQLTNIHKKQTDIVADILEEEAARLGASNKELSDDEIVQRLRTDGLLK